MIYFDAYMTAGLCTSKTFNASMAGSSITKKWWPTELLCSSLFQQRQECITSTGLFQNIWSCVRGQGALDLLSLPRFAPSQLDRALFVHFAHLVSSRTYCQCFLALGMREHVKNNSAKRKLEDNTKLTDELRVLTVYNLLWWFQVVVICRTSAAI